MGARCDYRKQARSMGRTPRQVQVIDELLTQKPVIRVTEGDYTRVGLTGLRLDYFILLKAMLEDYGFRIHLRTKTTDNGGTLKYYVLTFPGEENNHGTR